MCIVTNNPITNANELQLHSSPNADQIIVLIKAIRVLCDTMATTMNV
jgi:hypothetical protein